MAGKGEGEQSFERAPRPDVPDTYYFDLPNQELHELAMESRSFLFIDHAHHILLGRYTEDQADTMIPILDDIARRRKRFRDLDPAYSSTHAKQSVAERLSAPPVTVGHNDNGESLMLHANERKHIEAELKHLSFVLYESS